MKVNRLQTFLIFIITLGLLFIACTRKTHTDAVAKVGNHFLYRSELKGIVPIDKNKDDSLEIVKNYINNWIMKMLVLEQAKKNLTDEQMDFTRQLEDYKNSLIIYEYERKLINQKLDTVVTAKEISKYYDQNIHDFILRDNIVKARYVKILNNSHQLGTFRRLINSNNENDRYKLEDLCSEHAVNYFLDDNVWLLFNDLLKEIPIQTYNQEQYLKNNRFIQISDSAHTYLLNIKDFKIKESVSPLSFERDKIRDIIINKRKVDLINKMQEEVYQEAVEKNRFETY